MKTRNTIICLLVSMICLAVVPLGIADEYTDDWAFAPSSTRNIPVLRMDSYDFIQILFNNVFFVMGPFSI